MAEGDKASSGTVLFGTEIDEPAFEYVVEFCAWNGTSVYQKLSDIVPPARAVLLNDLATGVHRQWFVREGDETHGPFTASKIMMFKEGGFELLEADLTGATFQ